MSERQHEHHKPHRSPEHTHHTPEHHRPAHSHGPEREHRHEHKENLDEIQQSIEHHARHSRDSEHFHSPEATSGPSEAFVNRELKVMAYQRTMARVRRNLSPIERSFSKLIHNQVVDNASSALDKTIARPSSILGGGILAAIGGMVYYYVSKKYGYDYNATVLIVLFVAGYLGGLLVDAVKKLGSAR